MALVERAVDLAAIAFALLSTWLWFRATQRTLRRVSYAEALDAADINRIVVALNRSQILNRRAALATGCATLAGALGLTLDLFG